MPAISKCSRIFPYLCGIALISFTAYLVKFHPLSDMIRTMVQKQSELVEGAAGYNSIWIKLDMHFRVWVFDVLNPDQVMQGANPELRERGPYVYDMLVEKDVLKIHEDIDEMDYFVTRTYHFNKELSNGTEEDEVTLIHSVYMASMGSMATAFPSFLKKLGNHIQKLFPGMKDIFVRGTVGDILFRGMPMECDVNKYKELKMICGFLMGKKPAILKDTDTEGVYQWSFFNRLNQSAQGLLSVNRGVKNKSRLGDTTSFKGKRVQKFWNSPECNKVLGTDSITWAPMDTKLMFVHAYEPQICRWVKINFNREVVLNNLIGWRFEVDGEIWRDDGSECYCPVVKKQPVCPPTGLMDLTPCQEAPIFYSAPHFLHGDPALIEYARGLHPSAAKHAAYITIEPLSGVPLSGAKNLQLSVKLFNSPDIGFLSNVSDGYFPILWGEETKDADVESLAEVLQVYRLLRLCEFIIYVPLAIGVFLILRASLLHSGLPSKSTVKIEDLRTSNSTRVQRNPRIEQSEMSLFQRTGFSVNRA